MLEIIVAALALVAAPEAAPHSILIAGGGTTRAQGEAALAEHQETRDAFDAILRSKPGYPRVMESAQVEGLKPGFFVVVLGVCADGAASLAAYKAIDPRIYTREVRWSEPEACPELVEPWLAPVRAELKTASGVLSVASFATESGKEYEVMRGHQRVTIALLRDPQGKVLARKVTPGPHCALPTISKRGATLIAEGVCAGDCCTVCRGAVERTSYAVDGVAITPSMTSKGIRKGEICD